jgi:hypothetical protein
MPSEKPDTHPIKKLTEAVARATTSKTCAQVVGSVAIAFTVFVTVVSYREMGGTAPASASTGAKHDGDTNTYNYDIMWTTANAVPHGPRMKTTAHDFTEVRYKATAITPKYPPVSAFGKITGASTCTPIPIDTVVLFDNAITPEALGATGRSNQTVPMAKSAINVLGSANPVGTDYYDRTLRLNCQTRNKTRAKWYNYKLTSDAIANMSGTPYLNYEYDPKTKQVGAANDESFAYYYSAKTLKTYKPADGPETTYPNKAAEMFNTDPKSGTYKKIKEAAEQHLALLYLTAGAYSQIWHTCDKMYKRANLIAKDNIPSDDTDYCDTTDAVVDETGVAITEMPHFKGGGASDDQRTWSLNYAMMGRMADMIANKNTAIGTFAKPKQFTMVNAASPSFVGPGWGGKSVSPNAVGGDQDDYDDGLNAPHSVPQWRTFSKGCIHSKRSKFVTTCAMMNSRGCGLGNCGMSAAFALFRSSHKDMTDHRDILHQRSKIGHPEHVLDTHVAATAALKDAYDANGAFSVASPQQTVEDTHSWRRLRSMTMGTMVVGTLGFVLIILSMLVAQESLGAVGAHEKLGKLRTTVYVFIVVHIGIAIVLTIVALTMMGPQYTDVLASTSEGLHQDMYARSNVLMYYYATSLACFVFSTVFARNLIAPVDATAPDDATDTKPKPVATNPHKQSMLLKVLYAAGYLSMLLEAVLVMAWASQEIAKKTCDHSGRAESGLVGAIVMAAVAMLFGLVGLARNIMDSGVGGAADWATNNNTKIISHSGDQLSKEDAVRPTHGVPLMATMFFILSAVWMCTVMAGPGVLSTANPGCGANYWDTSQKGFNFGDIMHMLMAAVSINVLIGGIMFGYILFTALSHPVKKSLSPFEKIATIVNDTLATTFSIALVTTSTRPISSAGTKI